MSKSINKYQEMSKNRKEKLSQHDIHRSPGSRAVWWALKARNFVYFVVSRNVNKYDFKLDFKLGRSCLSSARKF